MHEAQKFRGLHVDIFPYEGNMIPWLQRLAAKLSVNVNTKLAGRYPQLAQMGYKFPTCHRLSSVSLYRETIW